MKKEEGVQRIEKYLAELTDLQNILFAQKKYSLLIVLQGMDAAGKDGTIKKVFSGVNPMGCSVAAFKKPTDEEMAHDFLWRIHHHVPAKGMIQIFNRSHYEDVLIQRVHKWVGEDVIAKRFEHINNFERLLQDTNTVVLKFYLHVSKDEQLKNLTDRLEDPTKKWKYNAADLQERELWDEYMKAYEDVFAKCSKDIPWTIVPADQNWYKELVVAKTIVDALKKLDLVYPQLPS